MVGERKCILTTKDCLTCTTFKLPHLTRGTEPPRGSSSAAPAVSSAFSPRQSAALLHRVDSTARYTSPVDTNRRSHIGCAHPRATLHQHTGTPQRKPNSNQLHCDWYYGQPSPSSSMDSSTFCTTYLECGRRRDPAKSRTTLALPSQSLGELALECASKVKACGIRQCERNSPQYR